jgi:hypothetical protein
MMSQVAVQSDKKEKQNYNETKQSPGDIPQPS